MELADKFKVGGPIAVPLTRHCRMYLAESNLPRTVDIPHNRHSGMFLAGLNLPGADLNSQRLARRAAYMDVCCNPVT